ncbi:hypothetical protein P154DRAFT_576340 [Amniculicola lignicola CBS 123094]|uniref:Uncharacterized protein n=1 Tax=Amniculicola lignicola CBS 123094 TaxID=1392246 RepID=A0A6A5WGE9_9PLEO|nr:hypothetical protein P154DRAFT_576340 [Amniculicola lignicola CBS 123094]
MSLSSSKARTLLGGGRKGVGHSLQLQTGPGQIRASAPGLATFSPYCGSRCAPAVPQHQRLPRSAQRAQEGPLNVGVPLACSRRYQRSSVFFCGALRNNQTATPTPSQAANRPAPGLRLLAPGGNSAKTEAGMGPDGNFRAPPTVKKSQDAGVDAHGLGSEGSQVQAKPCLLFCPLPTAQCPSKIGPAAMLKRRA